jgi:hypothetical protein
MWEACLTCVCDRKEKWSEKVTDEQVIERIGEKRTLLNFILRRNANWIGNIMR